MCCKAIDRDSSDRGPKPQTERLCMCCKAIDRDSSDRGPKPQTERLCMCCKAIDRDSSDRGPKPQTERLCMCCKAIDRDSSDGDKLGRFSGGSMNPARSLGPAIITGVWEHHWVYWIGPVLGAVLAGVSHEFFFAASASRHKLVACLTCKDIEMVETASVSRSSLSTVTQTAMRAKQANKQEHN
ncbi:hypothetical protein JZ751_003669 [Albula glossodonta]|uniref:Aquaporin n=1 Tax=Albula glossodonta TaxID=121402 RepID=A0A8T2MYU0_9TELE|nr:hypothetical protein JZ751_003669 [Albula glossodonta]